MKLGYYHYYFRERRRRNPPRVLHDLRATVAAYLACEDNQWKAQFRTDDDEQLLMIRTENPSVFMIVGTRQDDLIKAINTHDLTCSDLTAKLAADEKAGFAGYFSLNDRMIGMASTLRGPKTAALARLVNHLLNKLDAARWAFEVKPIGTSVTIDEAKSMSFVSRTSIRVRPDNGLFNQVKQALAMDDDNVASLEITIRAKKGANLHEVMQTFAPRAAGDGLAKMTLRARAVLDDELTDYFVSAQGHLSDEIKGGTEQEITQRIAATFAQNQMARDRLTGMMEEAEYAQPEVEDLTRLGDAEHWRARLLL